MRTVPVWSMAALATASLALAAVACGAGPASGSAEAGAESTTSPWRGEPWRGTHILHARIGDHAEEWLDTRTGATRYVEPEGGSRFIRIQDGRRIVSWSTLDRRHVSLAEVVDPNDPWLEDASQLLGPWRMLRSGRAHIEGSGVVGGKPVWIVQSDAELSEEAPPGLKLFVDVDKATLLPVRFRGVVGGTTHTVLVTYERVSARDVPKNFFSTKRRWTSRERRLEYRDLASLPFPVYALRRGYGEYRFGASTFREQKAERIPRRARGGPEAPNPVPPVASGGPRPGEVFRPPATVHVGYTGGDPYAEPAIQLIEHAWPAGKELAHPPEQPAKAYSVTIAGEKRRVFLYGGEGVVWFAVVIDETYVQGHAALPRAAVLRMLSSLEEVK